MGLVIITYRVIITLVSNFGGTKNIASSKNDCFVGPFPFVPSSRSCIAPPLRSRASAIVVTWKHGMCVGGGGANGKDPLRLIRTTKDLLITFLDVLLLKRQSTGLGLYYCFWCNVFTNVILFWNFKSNITSTRGNTCKLS